MSQVGNHFRRVMTGQAGEPRHGDPGDSGDRSRALCVGGTGCARARPPWQTRRRGADRGQASDDARQIRSGDLGEIYATEWIDAHSGGYRAPIKRLRWKDHRNMAMRGDDVIGILQDAANAAPAFPEDRGEEPGQL